jgi:hypothetical protein
VKLGLGNAPATAPFERQNLKFENSESAYARSMYLPVRVSTLTFSPDEQRRLNV